MKNKYAYNYQTKPFYNTALIEDIKNVKLLLEKGINVYLMHAAKNGDMGTVKVLLENNADINARDDYGWTALMWAAYNGYTEIVNLLLENNADVNAQNVWGNTALIWAARKGHTPVVKSLLEKGADVNIRDKENGWNALVWAAWSRNDDVVNILVNHKL